MKKRRMTKTTGKPTKKRRTTTRTDSGPSVVGRDEVRKAHR
jgi:hypothetical protein